MRRRVENYMKYVEEKLSKPMSKDEKEIFIQKFLIQLAFYQHERLIHLLVTLAFALIGVFSFFACLFIPNYLLLLFTTGTLIFLLFYIRHYFFLERSVQKMYTFYDTLEEEQIFTENIINP